MIIDAIADILELTGIGEVGTDIFIGEIPLDKQGVVSLMHAPSPEPNKSIPYYTQTIDVWAKFSDYDLGMAKMQSIMDFLHRKENYGLTGFYVYLSYAMGMIDDFDRDSERNHLFKMSFSFVYRVANELS